VARIKDVQHLSDCGATYAADIETCDCSGPVEVCVKGPRDGSKLVDVVKRRGRTTLRFENGDHIHAKTTTRGVVIDHDD